MENKLNEKLFAIQQSIGKISKDATNPFYKSKYFDINSLLNHLHPLLIENKLILLQPIEDNSVCSVLIDVETGERMVSSLKLPTIEDPQKIGSCITYYRRYTLQSLLALQAEDDDANLASKKEAPEEQPKEWISDKITGVYIERIKKGEKDLLPKIQGTYKVSHKNLARLTEALNLVKV